MSWKDYHLTCDKIKQRQDKNYAVMSRKPQTHADPNTIPPWMGDRAEEYLSLVEPFPDDFGIPEFITTDQWRGMHDRECSYEDTPERRMAWRLFAITVGDCFNGKPKQRLKYIEQIRNWVNDVTPNPRWEFGYWATLLGFDEDWVRGKLLAFLDTAENYATLGTAPNPEVVKLLRDVVGKYKSRPTGLRKNNASRQQLQVIEMWTE